MKADSIVRSAITLRRVSTPGVNRAGAPWRVRGLTRVTGLA